MQKQRRTYNHPFTFMKLILGAQNITVCHPRKTRQTSSGSTAIKLTRIGKKLSPISLLSLISFRPRIPKNVIEANKKTVQTLGSIPLW